jgi:hypothetical protein
MTMGSESFGNGSAKTEDRFATQLNSYRSGVRRDPGAGDDGTGDDLSPRNGSAVSLDRIASSLDAGAPIGSSLSTPKLVEPALPDLGLGAGLGGSVFASDSWLDSGGGSLADHPLLRGLLLELPPKGSLPPQDWLDRWFEAARSILELLYSQEAGSRP